MYHTTDLHEIIFTQIKQQSEYQTHSITDKSSLHIFRETVYSLQLWSQYRIIGCQ